MKKIAQQIHKKGNYENITFASENARSANMINAVLQCHGEGKKASTSDFVEGGIPSHYFWGKNGIASDKLDNAVWEGWCEGFGIKLNKESEVKPEKEEEVKEEKKEEIKEEKKKKGKEVKKEKEVKKKRSKKEKEVSSCCDKIKEIGQKCWNYLTETYNSCLTWLKNKLS
ncbi:MAG: hypothetical protein L6V95_12335 [Candidatus Melainabacteria bacterium]|nr:MAG: hypothetical protein L6V95_12335 [Candidatus Melainabacteria bacterium]